MIIELNDAELVGQIGSGAPQAEAELFRRMAPRIRLYGLRHLRDEHAADDLTQQVLITTLETLRAGHLREPEKLASFYGGDHTMTEYARLLGCILITISGIHNTPNVYRKRLRPPSGDGLAGRGCPACLPCGCVR